MSRTERPFTALTKAVQSRSRSPSDRVHEVRIGLAGTGDGEALRHRTRTETCYLGEDEPHPVGLLLSGYQL